MDVDEALERVESRYHPIAPEAVLAAEVRRLRAVLDRVRELHRPNARGNICETCLTEEPFMGDDWGNADWPCATVRALGEAG